MIFRTDIDAITQYKDEISKFDNEKIFNLVKDPYTFTHGIVLNDVEDLVLGLGIVRVVDEFKVVLNPSSTNLMKAKTLRYLLGYGITQMSTNEVIASITQGGDQYVNILEKHYKFYKDTGILVRMEK